MHSKEEKLNNLLEVLKSIDLDFNWLLALTSLSAQEIVIKRKLESLGESYDEQDFQMLAEKLIKTMESRGIEPPHILLSIVRADRHIRAKIIHDPHKTRLNAAEANAIFTNTVALINTLFNVVTLKTSSGVTKKKISIKAFLLSKTPESYSQKILAIGYYLEKYENFSSFTAKDLEEGFRVAKEKNPSNINNLVYHIVKKGYMMETKERKDNLKSWILTNLGEKYVENDFQEE